MRTYDLTPLFRSSGGIDRWNDLFDAALRVDDSAGYPPYTIEKMGDIERMGDHKYRIMPYNIEKMGDDKYRIMMAVVGFGENDIEITAQENLLIVSGNLGKARDAGTRLATRAFERRFSLADHVKIVGAMLAGGVLQIDLEQDLPEAMKPRHIAVEGTRPPEHL